MTRPIDIPPPGAPLIGLSDVLSEIAESANRDDMPARGIFGIEGTTTEDPPLCSVALFETTDVFALGPPSPTWTEAPNNSWYCAPATLVEYYPTSKEWATPAEENDSGTTPLNTYIFAPSFFSHSGSSSGAGTVIGADPGIAKGTRVWCVYDESSGCWCIIATSGGDILCFGLTKTAVLATDATFTVDHISAAGRGPSPTSHSADSMTIKNAPWGLGSGGLGWSAPSAGYACMFVLVSITGTPGSGANIGLGNFVQGPCISGATSSSG